MSDDPYAAFSTPVQAPAPAAPASPAADPYAAFSSPADSTLGGDHVLTIHARAPAAAAPAPNAQPSPAQGQGQVQYDPGAAGALVLGAVNGIPIAGPAIMSGINHAAAGLHTLVDGSNYDDNLARAEAVSIAGEQQHPTATTIGNIGGAVLGTAPLVAAAPAFFGAGPGALTAGKMLAGGATGAAIGGLDAATRPDANVGAGIAGGAIGGAAGPVIGAALGRTGEALADYAAHTPALRNIGVSQPAAEILTRAGEADGILGGQGAANITAAGPNGMLADAGPGMQNVLDVALQRGGPGAVAARQAVEQRAAQASQHLDTAMDATLGQTPGVTAETTALRQGTAAARSNAYDTAYAQPIDYSSAPGQELEQIVRRRVPASIIARANAQMRIDGDVSPQILARIADDGSVTYERLPDVRQIDYIKRALDDVARKGDGQGALGGNTSEGRSYANLSRELRDRMADAVPEYRTALATAASPIQARNALDFGEILLSRAMKRDEAAEIIGRMTAPERQAALRGVRAHIAENMANVTRVLSDSNVDAREAITAIKELSSKAARQKLGMLLSQRELAALTAALDRQTRALELRAALAGNSRTAARLLTDEGVKAAVAPGTLGTLAEGKPYNAAQRFTQFVTRRTPADMRRREDAIYGELAQAITGLRGQQAADFMNRLSQAHAARASAGSIARQIPYTGAVQTGLLSLLPQFSDRRK